MFGPIMVFVIFAQQSDPRTGVEQNIQTRPKSARWAGFDDKSGGEPEKQPTKSPARLSADGIGGDIGRCAA